MKATPTIQFLARESAVLVNGTRIETAPTVQEMYSALGEPSRVWSGSEPAPYGHRNNHVHVYDSLGLTFYEHHYTRRAECVTCWFIVDDDPFEFTPRRRFEGKLLFEDMEMPRGGLDKGFFANSPLEFMPGFAGAWQFASGGFSIFINSRGPKLRSGRRSVKRQITDVHLSWPHDPWGEPAVDNCR